ncbi:hypothetical protein BDV93DRAFT_519421 [Ceratobasidium sp. AG-I]|nr:hypothetical protein BDV93DRAFT_519421 [Ceratobasidium sp. AG-I]
MADPAAVADALHHLETAMFHIFASKCLAIAGACILCYDHIVTFPEEVALVWKQKWSLVSTLFVLNRYITPIVVALDIYDKGGLAKSLSQSFCINWYYGETVWNIVSFGLIHALVALRVHAIWGRPRWLSITLIVLFVIYFVVTAVIAFKFQIEFSGTVAFNPLFKLCFAEISPHLWTCWLPALVYESILFGLTITKAAEHSKRSINTPILYVLYRDGVMYFVIICCCSLFNMMVWLLAPPTLVALSKYFVLSVVPTMGARLVLNLKGARREDLLPTGRSTSDDPGFEMHGKISANKSAGDRLVFSPSRKGGLDIKDASSLPVNDHAYMSRSRTDFDFDDATRDTKPQGTWNVV